MPEATNSAARRPVVLIVDDELSGAEALALLLQDAGYEILSAHSGAEAIERAQTMAPDLVLLDVMMTGMDGFETCERLHHLPGLSHLPVIFLTGSSERADVAKAFNTGGIDYVKKPFVLEELLARVRTHADLKLSRDRMAQMLSEREEITNVVAHDLKNPLACVLFAAQSLERPDRDRSRDHELVDEIVDAARDALSLIQRFLARGAEGQRLRQFSARSVNLLDLVHRAVRSQRTAAEAHVVDLQARGEPATVHVDPDVTLKVLQNLLSNAIQYSPTGACVEVEVCTLPSGFAQCRVMDRGPGIAEADRARLFTRFLSLASAKARAEYSSGLGLAIAKHDVTQMGGYLWHEAREGGGSVFGFDLPAP